MFGTWTVFQLMEAKTADVRQKAINGYVEENDKYKEIDEKIKKVDNSMKNRHLAGANMVSRIKEMQKQNTLQNGVTVQKKPPPPPPPLKKPTRTSSDEDQENEKTNVIFRTTPYENSRRPLSVPTPEIYSSVNGRRRQFCALCHSEAYLAEQMIIEKMVIHRKCFKCSFCEQPLRLGNSALDRDLMDKFGPRWFCSQHNILPLHEKIAKIEKLDKKNGVRAASVAIVAPTPVLPSPQKVVSKAEIFLKPEKLIIPSSTNESTKSHYFSARNTPIRHQETIDEPPPKEKQNLHSVNSPSALLQRTMERLKERQDRLAALGTPPQSTVTVQGITTGERVEFEPTRRKISTSKEMHHFTVNDREDSSHTEEEDVISEEDSEKSMDEFNDGILEGTKTEDEEDIGDEFRTSKPSGEMVKKKNEALTEEESFDDDEIWSEFNEALETTLTQNLDQKISEQQALEIISNFNKRISINQLKTIPNLYVTPPSATLQTPSINSDKSEYFTPMTSSRSTKREDDDSDDFQTPKARPVLKRSSTESKIEVDANAIRERQIQRYNEMKELHRKQAKLKSDQELEQKHPSNRSSVPSESILYRLHNAYSNEEDGKNRARLDEPETSTKLSILDYMPSLQKVNGRRRSRTRSRSPPPPVLPFTTNQSRQKHDFEKRAGSDEPTFYTANSDSPRKETRANSDITGGVFSRFVNVEDDETALTKTSNPTKGHWFESSPSPNQLRNSESQKEENMLDRMRRLKVRNAERRATVAVNLDRERQQELEKMRRNEQIQDQMDRLKEQQAARKLAKGEDASESGVKLRSEDKMDRQRSKSRDVKLRIGLESNDPSIAISPQNIKRVQRQAQKIIIRREQERQRTAQDIQRGLDETENRISEVFVVGAELETALQKDPKNSWLLENWLLYVQELLQLQLREEDLNMRVKEISVAEQYRQLKFELQELQSQSGGEIGPNIEIEKRLMEKIIEVLNEHNQIKAEMDEASKSNRKTVFEIQKILENHGRTYQNFEPVFSIDRVTASYATKRILLS